MLRTGLGVLGLPLSEFERYTINDYVLAVSGYREKRKEEWEMVRTVSYYSLVAMQGSKIKPDMVSVPGDPPLRVKDKRKAKWRKLK